MNPPAIEKGIEIPPSKSGANPKYDFDSMDINDSLFFPIINDDLTVTQNRALARARASRRRNKFEFTSRRVEEIKKNDETGEIEIDQETGEPIKKKGVRVWRVA